MVIKDGTEMLLAGMHFCECSNYLANCLCTVSCKFI